MRYSANGYCSRMLCSRTSQLICYFSHNDIYNVHNTRVVNSKSARYSSTCIPKRLSVNVSECITNDFLTGPYLLRTWLYGSYYHFLKRCFTNCCKMFLFPHCAFDFRAILVRNHSWLRMMVVQLISVCMLVIIWMPLLKCDGMIVIDQHNFYLDSQISRDSINSNDAT